MGKRKYTTVKERQAVLKKLGVTAADMERFWNENLEINFKIRMLAQAGKDWTDLTSWQMEQLPTLKEHTLAQKAAKEKEEKEKERIKQESAEKKAYYEEHFENIILDKLDNKTALTEEEISRLVYEYEVDRLVGENRRWSRTNTSIISINSRYFQVTWEEGLTEMQENVFSDQPFEVLYDDTKKTETKNTNSLTTQIRNETIDEILTLFKNPKSFCDHETDENCLCYKNCVNCVIKKLETLKN